MGLSERGSFHSVNAQTGDVVESEGSDMVVVLERMGSNQFGIECNGDPSMLGVSSLFNHVDNKQSANRSNV